MVYDHYEVWETAINKTVRFVVYDFPGVDREDVLQDLWEFVLSNPSLHSPDDDGVMGLLMKIGKRICWQYRKEDLRATSQYDYRPSDVRMILDNQFDYDDWCRTYVPPDCRSQLGNDHLDLAAEMSVALKQLQQESPSLHRAVVRWYGDNDRHPAGSPERYTHGRAINRLVEILNRYN